MTEHQSTYSAKQREASDAVYPAIDHDTNQPAAATSRRLDHDRIYDLYARLVRAYADEALRDRLHWQRRDLAEAAVQRLTDLWWERWEQSTRGDDG